MEFSVICETFYWVTLFYPQGDPLEAVPGPKTNYTILALKVSLDKAY